MHIVSLRPALASPERIGATVDWTAKATDTNPGPLTFQFNVAPPKGAFSTVKQFNLGALSGGTWKSLVFAWALTATNGVYRVQVVATDFTSGESDSKTVSFKVTSPVTGVNPVVQETQNPLVALFTAPPCTSGSAMRVSFQPQSGSVPATTTNWAACQAPGAMTFEIAGMYPSTAYNLYSQVSTGSNTVNGPTVSFTTGSLPASVTFPTFTAGIPDSAGDPNRVLFYGPWDADGKTGYPDVATDLSGNIVWYNSPNDPAHLTMLVRPLPTGFLAIQFGPTWNPAVQQYQVLRQYAWAGNIVRETNTGNCAAATDGPGEPGRGALQHDSVAAASGGGLYRHFSP